VGNFYVKKRAYERIPVHIQATYFYNNQRYSGTVKDLSINGMFIEADESLPIKSKADLVNPFKSYCIVHIRFRKEMLKVIVKVRRLAGVDSDFTCMGVELVNPSQDYLGFVSSIRNYCLINLPHPSQEQLKDLTT